MLIDARTPAETLGDDRALYALHGQMAADAIDRDRIRNLADLGLIVTLDHGRAATLTADGLAHLALLRILERIPRGTLTVTATAPGATFHYWPRGFGVPRAEGGGRILAARYRADGILDYAGPFHPIGTSGRAEAPSILAAHAYAADRAACLEAEALAAYRNPWG